MKIIGMIFLGLFGIILLTAIIIFFYVRKGLKKMARDMYGTNSIVDALNQSQKTAQDEHKSVNSMTKTYLPQIMRDFPEFSYDQFKTKAEHTLLSALAAISNDNTGLIKDASEEFKVKVRSLIEMNQANELDEDYSDCVIHQTEITAYTKRAGVCRITLQSALEYYHTVRRKSDGKVIQGKDGVKAQDRYNVELIYIQDKTKMEKIGHGNDSIGSHCPNCGAPVTSLGAKHCEYCGTALTQINLLVWSINNFTKV
ncbi:MAG: zinc ribbon domain-containing protein [Ruminococcus sp.]|nr:zinc ribbon domain-containing protein [Ruminococcus sp.]